MQTLVSALANGAGKCDAKQLNARGQWVEKAEGASYQDCRNNKDVNLGNYMETWRLVSSPNYEVRFVIPREGLHFGFPFFLAQLPKTVLNIAETSGTMKIHGSMRYVL